MHPLDDESAHRMDDIDPLVRHLFRLVADGLSKATNAFLAGDTEAAQQVIAADTEFDSLQEEIEAVVEQQLLAGTSPGDLGLLLAVVRIVPELERSGDLVEHIALRTTSGLASRLTIRSRQLIAEMSAIDVELWRAAATAYETRDRDAAELLRMRDDDVDDLHVRLTAELGRGTLPPAAAIEMGLVARFYERLGDHAVNVVRSLPRTEAMEMLAS